MPELLRNSANFFSKTTIERTKSRAVKIWGTVGQVAPPHIISPITIEPTKPRMCIDLRYLNCWMVDTPFVLDSLVDITRLAQKDAFMTKLDDKSGLT